MIKLKLTFIGQRKHSHIVLSLTAFFLILIANFYYFSQIMPRNTDSYSASAAQTSSKPYKLAIIIDDFGQNRNGVKEMMSIDRHMTFAIMPFLTFTQSDAEEAYKKGYEIIVHLPMESYNAKMSWVGPKPILSAMNNTEIQELVIDAFDSVPHALGANIHMGAKAGGDEHVITSVLDVIKAKNLYFVDSRTAKHPIAKKIADEKCVLCYDRNVFLDGKKSKEYIKDQLKLSGEIAMKKGEAVAIGHVGTEGGMPTVEAINEMLPYFDSNNIQLVYVSELGK